MTTRHFLSLSYFKVLLILSCPPSCDLPGCPALAAACVGGGGGLPAVPWCGVQQLQPSAP